jgi:hypothetical protein
MGQDSGEDGLLAQRIILLAAVPQHGFDVLDGRRIGPARRAGHRSHPLMLVTVEGRQHGRGARCPGEGTQRVATVHGVCPPAEELNNLMVRLVALTGRAERVTTSQQAEA